MAVGGLMETARVVGKEGGRAGEKGEEICGRESRMIVENVWVAVWVQKSSAVSKDSLAFKARGVLQSFSRVVSLPRWFHWWLQVR